MPSTQSKLDLLRAELKDEIRQLSGPRIDSGQLAEIQEQARELRRHYDESLVAQNQLFQANTEHYRLANSQIRGNFNRGIRGVRFDIRTLDNGVKQLQSENELLTQQVNELRRQRQSSIETTLEELEREVQLRIRALDDEGVGSASFEVKQDLERLLSRIQENVAKSKSGSTSVVSALGTVVLDIYPTITKLSQNAQRVERVLQLLSFVLPNKQKIKRMFEKYSTSPFTRNYNKRDLPPSLWNFEVFNHVRDNRRPPLGDLEPYQEHVIAGVLKQKNKLDSLEPEKGFLFKNREGKTTFFQKQNTNSLFLRFVLDILSRNQPYSDAGGDNLNASTINSSLIEKSILMKTTDTIFDLRLLPPNLLSDEFEDLKEDDEIDLRIHLTKFLDEVFRIIVNDKNSFDQTVWDPKEQIEKIDSTTPSEFIDMSYFCRVVSMFCNIIKEEDVTNFQVKIFSSFLMFMNVLLNFSTNIKNVIEEHNFPRGFVKGYMRTSLGIASQPLRSTPAEDEDSTQYKQDILSVCKMIRYLCYCSGHALDSETGGGSTGEQLFPETFKFNEDRSWINETEQALDRLARYMDKPFSWTGSSPKPASQAGQALLAVKPLSPQTSFRVSPIPSDQQNLDSSQDSELNDTSLTVVSNQDPEETYATFPDPDSSVVFDEALPGNTGAPEAEHDYLTVTTLDQPVYPTVEENLEDESKERSESEFNYLTVKTSDQPVYENQQGGDVTQGGSDLSALVYNQEFEEQEKKIQKQQAAARKFGDVVERLQHQLQTNAEFNENQTLSKKFTLNKIPSNLLMLSAPENFQPQLESFFDAFFEYYFPNLRREHAENLILQNDIPPRAQNNPLPSTKTIVFPFFLQPDDSRIDPRTNALWNFAGQYDGRFRLFPDNILNQNVKFDNQYETKWLRPNFLKNLNQLEVLKTFFTVDWFQLFTTRFDFSVQETLFCQFLYSFMGYASICNHHLNEELLNQLFRDPHFMKNERNIMQFNFHTKTQYIEQQDLNDDARELLNLYRDPYKNDDTGKMSPEDYFKTKIFRIIFAVFQQLSSILRISTNPDEGGINFQILDTYDFQNLMFTRVDFYNFSDANILVPYSDLYFPTEGQGGYKSNKAVQSQGGYESNVASESKYVVEE